MGCAACRWTPPGLRCRPRMPFNSPSAAAFSAALTPRQCGLPSNPPVHHRKTSGSERAWIPIPSLPFNCGITRRWLGAGGGGDHVQRRGAGPAQVLGPGSRARSGRWCRLGLVVIRAPLCCRTCREHLHHRPRQLWCTCVQIMCPWPVVGVLVHAQNDVMSSFFGGPR